MPKYTSTITLTTAVVVEAADAPAAEALLTTMKGRLKNTRQMSLPNQEVKVTIDTANSTAATLQS